MENRERESERKDFKNIQIMMFMENKTGKNGVN